MRKNHYLFIIIFFLLPFIRIFGQVSINTDGSSSDISAILDVKSTTKGFLPPRVALISVISADPISAPAVGLLVFNTSTAGTQPNNVRPGYYYWNGTMWVSVSPPQGNNPGDMLYWNGTQWIEVPVGQSGQVLTLNNGIPTWGGLQRPILNTSPVSNIKNNGGKCGGYIASDGGSPVTARGVCWSTTPNPTVADNITTDGSGTGIFSSNMTGMAMTTLYYVRAYATNAQGTSYGSQVTFTTIAYTIGDSHGGGIIFYLDSTNQHGLIAAAVDQGSAPWGCQGTSIPGTSYAFGTGQSNTNIILSACSTPGIAARICDDLVLNGYSDWYLPSKQELNLMFGQNSYVGLNPGSYYWCSSETIEYPTEYAWLQSLYSMEFGNKNYNYTVRAIRTF